MSPRRPSARPRRALRRLVAEQAGVTVVEGVVAALLLVIGALGVLQVFDASTRNNFRAEQSQVVNNRLQAELERIRQLPYSEIALTGYPQASSNENDPGSRVAGTTFAVDRSGADHRELVVNGGPIPDGEGTVTGGVVDPGPEPFEVGDVSGEIHRFIAWSDDPSCPECGEGQVKRIVVAATLDDVAVSFDRRFQEVQSEVADTEAAPDDNPAPPGDETEGNVVELWLTDTTCDNQTRLTPDVPHPTHNTRGRCANGMKTGTARGAPDLMFTEAPPEADEGSEPPLSALDFSSDVTGSADGVGLTMPWASTDSCLLEPVLSTLDIRKLLEGLLAPLLNEPGPLDGVLDLVGGDSNKHLRMHTWLSRPVGGSGGVLLGQGNLDLWTRTVNGTSHPGEICVTLFYRQTVQVPVKLLILPLYHVNLEVDLPMVNVGMLTNQNGVVCQQGANLTYFRCSQDPWPASWSKVSVPMDFVAVNAAGAVIPAALPPGSRIGLSLMVKRSGTEPGQGLEFIYDHVDFNSRLQLRTESLLSFQGG